MALTLKNLKLCLICREGFEPQQQEAETICSQCWEEHDNQVLEAALAMPPEHVLEPDEEAELDFGDVEAL